MEKTHPNLRARIIRRVDTSALDADMRKVINDLVNNIASIFEDTYKEMAEIKKSVSKKR